MLVWVKRFNIKNKNILLTNGSSYISRTLHVKCRRPYVNTHRNSNPWPHGSEGVEPRMREMGVRSPVATDLSRKTGSDNSTAKRSA